ncbi:hypothetical protein ABTY20_25305 [Streptomyces sp. NPDC126497]
MAAPSPHRRNLTRPARIALATGVALVVAGALAAPGAHGFCRSTVRPLKP